MTTTETRAWPTNSEPLAILPVGTKPPAWVTQVEVEPPWPGRAAEFKWWAPVIGRDPSWRVQQWVTEVDGRLALSHPYITTDVDWFEWSVEEARAAAATLYVAAKLLLEATEQTWGLLGAAGAEVLDDA